MIPIQKKPLAQLYQQSRNIPEESAKNPLDESPAATEHLRHLRNQWTIHTTTTEYFNYLEQRKTEFSKSLVEIAASGKDLDKVSRLAANIKLLEEIINYGRTIGNTNAE